jgi:hypothetical protein
MAAFVEMFRYVLKCGVSVNLRVMASEQYTLQ